MLARVVSDFAVVGVVALTCWLLPAWGIRRLIPSFAEARPATLNYRGRRVTGGLGVVWLLWVAGLLLLAVVSFAALVLAPTGLAEAAAQLELLVDPWLSHISVIVVLVLAAFGFGLVDDVFGSPSAKGFSGHIGALLRGDLTTGALKSIGIGAAAAFAGSFVVGGDVAASADTALAGGDWLGTAAWLGAWLLAAAIIALSANLVNLTDVRPGRALKTYVLLAVPAMVAVQWAAVSTVADAWPDLWGRPLTGLWFEYAMALLWALLLVLGPLVAVWPFDLGERGMLGDAGANAAGALAGYLVALALPLWGLVAVAILLAALNLLSERVSFSQVIERTPPLRWMDALGRLPHDDGGQDVGEPDDPERAPGVVEAGAPIGTHNGKDGEA